MSGETANVAVTENDDPARPAPPTPSTACEPMCAAGTTKLTEPLPVDEVWTVATVAVLAAWRQVIEID